MQRFIISLGFVVLLCGCSTNAPSSTNHSSSSSAVAIVDAMTMLHTLQLPNAWKAIPGDCGQNLACIFSQKVYTGGNDAIDHDVLYVHPTAPDRCDATYAKTQSAQDGDGKDTSKPFVIAGTNLGYTWMGFAGAGAKPGDSPNMRFVCIRHANSHLDIEISSFATDASTLRYIDSALIPFWLNVR